MYVDDRQVRAKINELLSSIIAQDGRVQQYEYDPRACCVIYDFGYYRDCIQLRLKDGKYLIISSTGNISISSHVASRSTFTNTYDDEQTFYVEYNFWQYIKFRYRFHRAYKCLEDLNKYIASKNNSEVLLEVLHNIKLD